MLIILLFTLGYFSFQNIPIDAVPDITNIQVQINTTLPGFSPEAIEVNVTYPIENIMKSIPGSEEVRSITKYGLSQVTIVFRENTNLYLARQLVSEKLSTIKLPEGAEAKMGPISTGLGEVFFYELKMKSKPKNENEFLEKSMQLRTLQDWVIRPKLLSVKGVAEINTIGGYAEKYFIQPSLEKMSLYGIHFDEISRALKESNRSSGGGFIQKGEEQYIVEGIGLFRSLEEIENLPIKILLNLNTIRVKDIAKVGIDKELRVGAAVINSEESILGTVLMLVGENSRTVSLEIAKKMEDIKKNLPEDVEITELYNRSYLVNETISTVEHNLIYGAILVMLVLFILLGNFRASLITSFVIPCILIITVVLMYLKGISANLMSLGALDFGVLIDGAVIVIDHCVLFATRKANQYQRKLTREEVKEAVVDASFEIRKAAGFGELIIIIVFIPIFALTGVEGKMFHPMATAFCFALLGAFIFSFTLIPSLAGMFLSGEPSNEKNYIMRVLEKKYNSVLDFAFQYRKIVFGIITVLILFSMILLTRLGGEFIPHLYEGSIAFQVLRPVNTSLEQSLELDKKAHSIIREFKEVKNIFSRIGTAEIATDPMGVYESDIYITLYNEKDWPLIDGKKRTPDELGEEIRKKLLAEVKEFSILRSQPIQMRFNELLEGTRTDLTLKIFGDDLEKLQELSENAEELISKIPDSGEVETELRGKSPILSITPKTEMIQKYGITRKDILDTVQMGLGGEEVGNLYKGIRTFPLEIRLEEKLRSKLEVIENLPVGISDNFTLPLKQMADIKYNNTYLTIKREEVKRRTAILINPSTKDIEGFVDKAQRIVNENIKLPSGYYFEWGGYFQNLEAAKKRLFILIPIVFLLILFMIYSVFQNIKESLLILFGIPLALVGGVISLYLMKIPFSVSAGVGFIALSGISVLNGIVLISHFQELKKGKELNYNLIKLGSIDRLRPVLMTALTEILGFLPMMLATGMGAEVQRPLATVVIGGVFTSTILTLVMIPILYSLVQKKNN
jgi:cobalt-zinc-cadmium resistance protein CzcA